MLKDSHVTDRFRVGAGWFVYFFSSSIFPSIRYCVSVIRFIELHYIIPNTYQYMQLLQTPHHGIFLTPQCACNGCY